MNRLPSSRSDPAAAIFNQEYYKNDVILLASLDQSSSESWMMHNASTHRYRNLNLRVTSIASWNVKGRAETSIPFLRSTEFTSVVDDDAVTDVHRCDNVMYLPCFSEGSWSFGGWSLSSDPTSMIRVGNQHCRPRQQKLW
jgi:hypothetical protein